MATGVGGCFYYARMGADNRNDFRVGTRRHRRRDTGGFGNSEKCGDRDNADRVYGGARQVPASQPERGQVRGAGLAVGVSDSRPKRHCADGGRASSGEFHITSRSGGGKGGGDRGSASSGNDGFFGGRAGGYGADCQLAAQWAQL